MLIKITQSVSGAMEIFHSHLKHLANMRNGIGIIGRYFVAFLFLSYPFVSFGDIRHECDGPLDEGYIDANGFQPSAPRDVNSELLNCRAWDEDQPQLVLYYDTAAEIDDLSGFWDVTDSEAEAMFKYYVCAYIIHLLEPVGTCGEYPCGPFRNPLANPGRDWMFADDRGAWPSGNTTSIPIWVDVEIGSGGGTHKPPKNVIPARCRFNQPVTENTFHELAHVFLRGYGPLYGEWNYLFKEGLTTFFETVLRNDTRYASFANYPGCNVKMIDYCGPNRFVNLSEMPLHQIKYCEAVPFFYFLSEFSSCPEQHYNHSRLLSECQEYLADFNADLPATAASHVSLRRIPGRDVITAILDRIGSCFDTPPGGPDEIPRCSINGGHFASCISGLFPQGCQMIASDSLTKGDAALPLALGLIDDVLKDYWSLYDSPQYWDKVSVLVDTDGHDGTPEQVTRQYVAFRQYLEWNYRRDCYVDNPIFPYGERAADCNLTKRYDVDEHGFRIPSFGAHYHEIDISTSSRTVYLRKNDDLPYWAYGIFYRDNSTGQLSPVRRDGWHNLEHDTIEIPTRATSDTAVIIITAFEGVYHPCPADPACSASPFRGHYWLSTDRDMPLVFDSDHDGYRNDVGIYLSGSQVLYYNLQTNGTFSSFKDYRGLVPPNSTAVVSNFNGGRDDIAFFGGNGSSQWRIDYDIDGINIVSGPDFGSPGDIPVAADVNRDGTFDIGVYTSSTRAWEFDTNFDGVADVASFVWPGIAAEYLPIAGDFDGDHYHDDIGIYDRNFRAFYYNVNSHVAAFFDTETDVGVDFGAVSGLPAAGDMGSHDKTMPNHPDRFANDIFLFVPETGEWFCETQFL
jgi:hypothetical protein